MDHVLEEEGEISEDNEKVNITGFESDPESMEVLVALLTKKELGEVDVIHEVPEQDP